MGQAEETGAGENAKRLRVFYVHHIQEKANEEIDEQKVFENRRRAVRNKLENKKPSILRLLRRREIENRNGNEIDETEKYQREQKYVFELNMRAFDFNMPYVFKGNQDSDRRHKGDDAGDLKPFFAEPNLKRKIGEQNVIDD